ncbi:arginase family protein [Leucobacter sp. UT-8R-CII-1-4]|uniref:arginase family protein n=1 Tax=Leucobacter sp. UT-8R-CII-1-4 TaxID=3040075 RepID=UPI0024A7E6D5|nr:arginase family protein [Leucobacter sp. UT-8R-CII-1-4]MDI6022735.1 arginase family protein [Leucobacter sp. UT-8R-CII-1-4]
MSDLIATPHGLLGAAQAHMDDVQRGDIVIFGAPYGSPYWMSGVHSDAANAPRVFRERANRRFGAHKNRYDFSLGGTLLGDSGVRLLDLGDLNGNPRDLSANAAAVTATVNAVVQRGGVPIVLGGDDSVPILVAKGYQATVPTVNVLQIDAHIDFADIAHGRSDGFSSTMRRIREMPWVGQIVQVGARGTGSATPEDYAAALAAGNLIVPMAELRERGVSHVLTQMNSELPWFVTLDVDGLDPTIAPATSCPVPGGMNFEEAETLLAAVAGNLGLAGIDIVEHFPSLDVGETTSTTLSRLLSVLIGNAARARRHA